MRKLLILLTLFILLSSFKTSLASATIPAKNIVLINATEETKLTITERIASLKIKDAENILGRKLKLKEKIALKIIQLKIKKELKANEKGKPSKGQTSMVLGIISLACILIPFGILASIPLAILAIIFGSQARKDNHNDGKAQAGIILGIVSLGLIALAIFLVILILTAWTY